MYYKHLILGVWLITMLSCRQKEDAELVKDTGDFNTYLQRQFSTNIGSDSSVYIVTSADGCSSCLEKVFKENINKNFKNDVRVIISRNTVLKYDLEPDKGMFWVDADNRVDRLVFHKGNVGIIKTAEKKIYLIKSVEPFQIEEILKPLLRVQGS